MKIRPQNTSEKLILLTNDDGFYAPGIEILFQQLQPLGSVYIVAPDRERSATSLALTLHHPLRIKSIKQNIYAVDGTPADCIYLAVQDLLPRRPDIIISGINPGPNLGQQDIAYSGTVAGALQGTFLQIPAIAVSLIPDQEGKCHFDTAAEFTAAVVKQLLSHPLPADITLNFNIPAPPVKGIKPAKLGQKHYNPEIFLRKDPRGRDYYWIGTGTPRAIGDQDSDVNVVQDGYITVTPLYSDKSDYRTLQQPEFNRMCGKIDHEIFKKTV